MGCKREEKWHSHLIGLQISGRCFSPSRRKTAPAAEHGDEKRRLAVTRRAPPRRRRCAVLIAARRHSGSALFLWDADELWQLDGSVHVCVRWCFCVHTHMQPNKA